MSLKRPIHPSPLTTLHPSYSLKNNINKISLVYIMNSHDIYQLKHFKKLMAIYGTYTRVGNLCVFRKDGKATCVNIDSKYL